MKWAGGVSAWRNGVGVGAVVDGTVYAAGEQLRAFDIEDGTEQWAFTGGPPPESRPESDHPDIEPPTVVDGTVVAPIHYGVFDAFDHKQTALVALAADSGERQWRIEFPVEAPLSSVTATEDLLYIDGPDIDGGDGYYIYCLEPADGAIRWRQPVQRGKHPIADAPLVANELVFATPPSGVVAFDARTGEQKWNALPKVTDVQTGTVVGGTLYVSESTDPGTTVIALDTETGHQEWKQAYAEDGYIHSVAADARRLYFETGPGDGTSDVVALDLTDGTEQWRTDLPGRSGDDNPPTVVPRGVIARVGSLLYAGASVIEPASGEITQTFELEADPMEIYRVEAVARGNLFLGGADLVVVEGESSQTGTPLPADTVTTSVEDGATGTQSKNRDTDDSSNMDTADDNTAPGTPETSGVSSPDSEKTTATNGPGFGIPAAIAGLGLAGWWHRDR